MWPSLARRSSKSNSTVVCALSLIFLDTQLLVILYQSFIFEAMRFSTSTATLALAALTSVGTASPLEARDAIPITDYDCIVIGGGPSGLSAASGLARVRNKVLLVDSGEYRNELTRKIHDVIAIDGITPGSSQLLL